MTKELDLDSARRFAEEIRPSMPEKAAEIDRRIAEMEAGKRDSLNISATATVRVEKFDGEMAPGAEPVEVIERTHRLL